MKERRDAKFGFDGGSDDEDMTENELAAEFRKLRG